MEQKHLTNPWLGLQSYQEGEVLYGRDDDIRDLSQCVLNNADTLLYGKSGIGKSSILNAGIIPAARRNGFLPIAVRLSHKDEDSYLTQINSAIEAAILSSDSADEYVLNKRIVEVVPCVDPANESIYEYFHRHKFMATDDADGERCKLLIIFDQFEEIFTLQNDEQKKRKFFAELADFLNDVKPLALQKKTVEEAEVKSKIDINNMSGFDDLFNSLNIGKDTTEYVDDNEVHLVFTIREDFLSEFEYYASSIPSLKQNRYGLRPINDEQAAQIILRPRPGLISKDVAKLIIEKVTGRTDFELDDVPEIEVDSAVLSLYLNRLYDANTSDVITGNLVEEKGGEIIADFYHDSISTISDASVEYLENMLLNGQNRRDNITVYDAQTEGKVTDVELDTLCNKKKIIRQFNYAGDLRIEFVHDILCPVIKAHKEQREQQRLLDREKRKRKEIEAEAIRARKRARRRIFGIVAAALALFLIIGAIIGWDYYRNEMEIDEYYSAVELINGWPEGSGSKLNMAKRKGEITYFKLSKKGSATPHFTDIEICSSAGKLPSHPQITLFGLGLRSYTDTVAENFSSELSKVTKLHFTANEDGLIERTVALDENGKSLFIISYFHIQRTPNGVAWVSFVTPTGQSKEVTGSGIDRIKLSWDSLGRESSFMYYDAQYIRAAMHDKHGCEIYGHKFSYSDNSATETDIELNEIGMPLQGNDIKANTKITTTRNDTTIITYGNTSNAGHFDYALAEINAWREMRTDNSTRFYVSLTDTTKYVEQAIIKDKLGRTVQCLLSEQSTLNIAGNIKYEYDNNNNITRIEKLHLNSDRYWSGYLDTICYSEFKYDGETRTHELLKTVNGTAYLYDKTVKGNVTTIETLNKTADIAYRKEVITTDGNKKTFEYFGENGICINTSTSLFENVTADVHRIIQTKEGQYITSKYYTFTNGEIKPLQYTEANLSAISFPSKKETFDVNGNRTSIVMYDTDGNIRKSMMYAYENGSMIERSAMGIDGTPIRSDEWEINGYGYYKMHTVLNVNNILISFSITNEFDEASPCFDPAPYETGNYVKWKFVKYLLPQTFSVEGKTVVRAFIRPDYYYTFVDADGISNQQVAYLHLKSKNSALYKAGLKDGDRIIGIDGWKYSENLSGFSQAWQSLYTTGNHAISVLRPNTNQSFDLITKKVEQLATTKYQTERTYCYNLSTNEQTRFNNALKSIK